MTEIGLYRLFKIFGIIAGIVLAPAALALAGPGESTSAVPGASVPLQPAQPVKVALTSGEAEGWLSSSSSADGSIVLVTVRLPQGFDASAMSVSLEGTRGVPFFPLPSKGDGVFQEAMAVPFNHAPGKIDVRVSLGGDKELTLPLQVVDGHYRSETLKVDEKKVNPPRKELKRIFREQAEIKAIYNRMTREKLWDGPFAMPVDSVVTSPFGSKRVYNGEMKSFHQGMDLRAHVGTPIHAPAAGIVVLAKNLYFTGNTVLLDHGYGIFTIYGHMSQLKVKNGDHLARGALIGLAGMTGRANGPHLHWGAVVHHLKVNPLDLTRVLQ